MALFSVNQNGQWFTVKGRKAYNVTLTDDGDIRLEGDTTSKKIWFEYLSSFGGKNLTKRSEVVNINNGGYVTIALAKNKVANCVKLAMNSGVNSGAPIDNEVYGLYINQRNYHALGDNMFAELGAEVRYGSSFDLGNGYEVINSAAKLLNALALGLVRNLGADNDLYRVVVATASDAATTEVKADTDLHSTSTAAIYIMGKEQDWMQGTMQRENVSVSTEDFFLSEVTVNTMDRNDWGTLTNVDLNDSVTYSDLLSALGTASIAYSWTNGKDIADAEWFYLGEHGDNQRLTGYPNVSVSQMRPAEYYKVLASGSYDLITIHHAYVGAGNAVQKSEQDIMIACSDASSHTIAKAILNDLHSYISAVPATASFPSVNTTYTF